MNKLDSEIIKNENDLLSMLDNLIEKKYTDWWNNFYSDREKPIPFFKNIPDENLVSYISQGLLKKGKALDIGCGYGRNSFYLFKNIFGKSFLWTVLMKKK